MTLTMEHELTELPARSSVSLGQYDMDRSEDAKNQEREVLTSVDEEPKYISGFKLGAVVGSITLVVFILLLDVSIISTVS